jgi:hypothetical protein
MHVWLAGGAEARMLRLQPHHLSTPASAETGTLALLLSTGLLCGWMHALFLQAWHSAQE